MSGTIKKTESIIFHLSKEKFANLQISLLTFLYLPTLLLSFDFTVDVEGTDIIRESGDSSIGNYNRLRVYSQIRDSDFDNFLANLYIDNIHRVDTQFQDGYDEINIYRAYIKYFAPTYSISIGQQRVPFGVGRVWNPIDIYNPIDATSVEVDERSGTDSLRYEYALGDLSNLDITASEYRNAIRFKSYIDIADVGFTILRDDKRSISIIGYEVEGELFQSGIEFRSEGGYFHSDDSESYIEFIVGGEYSFQNSLSILGEYKHNSLLSTEHLAVGVGFTLSPLVTFNSISIQNLDDKSLLSLVRLDYSVEDDIEFNLGHHIYSGSHNSEFGTLSNSTFLRLFIHF